MASIVDIVTGIFERRNRNERVDREYYLQRYPEHANFLRRFFRGHDLIASLIDRPAPKFNGHPRGNGSQGH